MRDHLLDLLRVLASAKSPLSASTLIQKTKINRTSVYLHLKNLCAAGLVEKQKLSGHDVFRLSPSLALGQLTHHQISALLLTQQAVSSLRGSRLSHEIDLLVASLAERDGVQSLTRLVPPSTMNDGRLFDTVQDAHLQQRQLRVLYQGSKDVEPRWRVIEPVHFYLEGDQPYLEAYDTGPGQMRTFKLARVSGAEMLSQPCRQRATSAAHDIKRHSRKVWDAPLVEVVVRLVPSKARFAREWPLKRSGQQEFPQPDGSVLVKAQVAGTQEALKWVLSWGAGARVEAPIELRAEHIRELQEALAGYR